MSDTQSYIPESIITAIQIPKIPLPSLQKPPHISLADMIPYIIRPNKYFRKDYILPDYRSRPMGPIWSIKSDTWEEPEISVPNYPSPFVRPIWSVKSDTLDEPEISVPNYRNKYFLNDYILPDYRNLPVGPIWSDNSDTLDEPEISVPNYRTISLDDYYD